MSVYKSDRSTSSVKFLSSAKDLEIKFFRIIEKSPRKIKRFLEIHILDKLVELNTYLIYGNSIKIVDEATKLRRKEYFDRAFWILKAVENQINICYEVYKSDFMTNNEIREISGLIDEEAKLIRGVIVSDNKVYKKVVGKVENYDEIFINNK